MVSGHIVFIPAGEASCLDNLVMRCPISHSMSSNEGIIGSRSFLTRHDYRVYLACVSVAAEQSATDVHAYVLMTNHVHLLVTPRQVNGVAKMMQSIGRRYVYSIHTTYQRTGTLWEGRYKACLVEADPYFFMCSRYIELNPVRAGMVADSAAYPWSSYRWHAWGETDRVVTDHELYRALGRTSQERQSAYRALFQRTLDEGELQELRSTLHQCRVLGTERFKDTIERVLSRRVRSGKAGRPRQNVQLLA
jgi:putative transposase